MTTFDAEPTPGTLGGDHSGTRGRLCVEGGHVRSCLTER